MTSTDHRLLENLRRELLRLHKALLDWERLSYERRHGRPAPGELLRLVMVDPQFAWLRPVSELIVSIDETLGAEAAGGELTPGPAVRAIVGRARALVAPDESKGRYAQRYRQALQSHPDAVLAHQAVRHVLDAPAGQARPH